MNPQTLEPGDVDQFGNHYADEAAFNAAQERLFAAIKRTHECLECGIPVTGLGPVCEACEDPLGGDGQND